jgi:hypothetical protein
MKTLIFPPESADSNPNWLPPTQRFDSDIADDQSMLLLPVFSPRTLAIQTAAARAASA